MFIASVRPSVRPSVCLKPKFGRLKPKFDDDAEGGSAKRTRTLKTKFGPTFYVFYTLYGVLYQCERGYAGTWGET